MVTRGIENQSGILKKSNCRNFNLRLFTRKLLVEFTDLAGLLTYPVGQLLPIPPERNSGFLLITITACAAWDYSYGDSSGFAPDSLFHLKRTRSGAKVIQLKKQFLFF